MEDTLEIRRPSALPNNNLPLGRGQRLGKYRLVKRLGKGGYCEVWKARDTAEGIWVALKIPLAGSDGRRDNQTLLKEVRLLSRLRHRHLLPVKNADIIDGYAVMATEMSAGTLADRSKPMAPRKILTIIAQVLNGLDHAHKNHLLHCDVTPYNIFLFPDGRAALGDFGIGLQLKGRMSTIDEYGTPGYVAPEQAFGRPAFSSDCFSVALILYEYLTGYLPRWPFHWPFRGYERLRQKTSSALVRFLRQATRVDPVKRFTDAEAMLNNLIQVAPEAAAVFKVSTAKRQKKLDWRKIRQQAFLERYQKVFPTRSRCKDCGEPISEAMLICPWCGSDRNHFDTQTSLSHYCPDCHKGVLPEWRFCPWCYGAGFASPAETKSRGYRYHSRCRYCQGKLMRFMRYCPWCRRKVYRPWQVSPFPELCTRCGWSVDSSFWNYCPWCRQKLFT